MTVSKIRDDGFETGVCGLLSPVGVELPSPCPCAANGVLADEILSCTGTTELTAFLFSAFARTLSAKLRKEVMVSVGEDNVQVVENCNVIYNKVK